MGFFTAEELISRARTYCDDDHGDEKGWIGETRWLELLNVEYRQLYKRWLRSGLVTPEPATSYIVAATGRLQIDGVLAIVGVAKDYGGHIRLLSNAQQHTGRAPFWRGSTQPTNPSSSWAAYSQGDRVVIALEPVPSDLAVTGLTSNYVIRYIPTVTKMNFQPAIPLVSQDVYAGLYDVPDGADERLVLGLARRAHLKDSANSALLNGLIGEADAELNFTATGKVDGIRVKRLPKRSPLISTPNVGVWPQRDGWIYF